MSDSVTGAGSVRAMGAGDGEATQPQCEQGLAV